MNLDLSPSTIAARIGVPLDKWPGNCYGIASALVEDGLVEGRTAYGHWIGPVHPRSMFHATSSATGFSRHGWVLMDDGTVVDPTRYVFEQVEPYIYVGPNDHYDEGGNQFKKANLRPVPPDDPAAKEIVLPLDVVAANFVAELMADPNSPSREYRLTIARAFWLGNAPIGMLGTFAKPIYLALAKAGLKAIVPIDNWKSAVEYGG